MWECDGKDPASGKVNLQLRCGGGNKTRCSEGVSPPALPERTDDADGQNAALLNALGEVDVDEEDVSVSLASWSTAASSAFPGKAAANSSSGGLAMHGDWNGDADSRHAALLNALGEVEVDEEDVSVSLASWSTAASSAFPGEAAANSSSGGPAMHGDWNGDVDSRHAALLNALGEVEVDEEDVSVSLASWSTAASSAFPVEAAANSSSGGPAMHVDWNGDVDSRHAALLNALGEVDVDEEDVSVSLASWSTAASSAFPGEAAANSSSGGPAMHGDWNGDVDSRHAALLNALGEVEVDEEDVSVSLASWSTAASSAFPGEAAANSSSGGPAMHGDWNGDVDSRHAALLNALGEVEVDEEDVSVSLASWSTAASSAFPGKAAANSSSGGPAMHGDWNGDVDSRHAALLNALGEVEVDEEDVSVSLASWSTAASSAFPVEAAANSSSGGPAMHGDWNGDVDSRHAALLNALGEVEVDEEDVSVSWASWSTAASSAFPGEAAANRSSGGPAMHGEWNGDVDSRHAALLNALGEVEVDEEDVSVSLASWSTAASSAFPGEAAANSSSGGPAMHVDWNGDVDSRHAALLNALGEVDVDEEDVSVSLASWSTAASSAFPNSSSGGPAMHGDWNGDVDSRHAALLNALGEVEVDEEDVSVSLASWSTAASSAFPGKAAANSSSGGPAMHGDWNGDVDSRHAALLKALGEVDVDDADDPMS